MHREIATNRNRYCRSEERPESRSSLQIVVTWFPESRKSRLQLVEIHFGLRMMLHLKIQHLKNGYNKLTSSNEKFNI